MRQRGQSSWPNRCERCQALLEVVVGYLLERAERVSVEEESRGEEELDAPWDTSHYRTRVRVRVRVGLGLG